MLASSHCTYCTERARRELLRVAAGGHSTWARSLPPSREGEPVVTRERRRLIKEFSEG